jgi:hypothetical protein
MIHRPWTFADRLIAKMADSSIQATLPPRPPRTPGLHASTILRELHKQKRSDISEEDLALYGLMGLAFEDRAEIALTVLSSEEDWPWRCFRPGEVTESGIICSPDILLVPKRDGAMRELSLKCTWKSCRKLPTDHEGENEFDLKKWGYYFDQCMTYAQPLDTLGSVLLAYFVAGDYSNMKPQAHGWELDFSEQERAETWDLVVNTAQDLNLQ